MPTEDVQRVTQAPTDQPMTESQRNGVGRHLEVTRLGAPRPGLVWCLAIVSGLLAGLLGWSSGDAASRYLHWEAHVRAGQNPAPGRPDRQVSMLLGEARNAAERNNTALAMGALGGMLGLLFGAGAGLSRGSITRIVRGGTTGLLLGCLVGAIVPYMLVPLFYRSMSNPPNPALPLIIHTGMYAAIGAIGGIAFGMGFIGWRAAGRGLLAGAMGAVLGSLVYNILHTTFMPLEWDYSPMPGKTATRLLAHLCVSLLSVICVVAALYPQTQVHPRDVNLLVPDGD